MSTARRPLALRLLALLLVAALAACGGDDGSAASQTTADTAGVEVVGGVGETPQITVPDDEPPAELIVVDLVEGDGAEVPEGATVTTDYAGVSWLNGGAQFDSSFDRGQPATFPLSGVIPGWTQGIPGMKVGGRRLLIIPPDLAYGDAPPTPEIAPGDTLVFVIDLVEVTG
jgi:peptidylprolyl isomerase